MFKGVRSRFGFRGIAIGFTAAVALAIFPGELAAQSPSVGVSATNALVGQTITVTVANGPGQVMDWVALYPVGGANYSYTDWKYLNGLRTVPATGMTTATVTFTLPLAPGAFQVRFLANNSFTLLATSATINSTAPLPTVTVSPTPVAPGGPLTVVVANGPGNLKDWVGLFAIGSPDTAATSWKYVFGAAGATLQFLAPATPGMYEARFFSNDTYVRLATSSPFSVGSGPSLTVANVSTPEGNSGTTAFTFTVTLSPTSSTTVTVDYATSNGAATAGSDYVAAAGTLTFAPGVATRSATVLVNGDTSSEPNETFLLTLNNPTNALVGGAPGVGTIGNDDAAPTPTITVSPSIAAPGGQITVVAANGPGNANDWVALAATGSPATSSVGWRYLGGGTGATLTFTAPSTPGTYEARLFANDGYILLATSNPVTVQLQQSSTLSIGDVSLAEQDSGTTPATFMVTLSPAATNTVTVNYATSNGGATAGGDYVAASGALTFAAGVTTQSVSVLVNGDTLVEPDETFLVTLSSPTNAVLGDAQGAGSIVNDDAASILSVSNVSLAERDTGTTPATFTITVSPTTTNTVTVNYATANGSATAGVDYAAASGTLTFAPGIATRTVAVSINGDTIAEPDETFVLTLSNPTNAVLGVAQGNGSIVNDDAAPTPTITVSPSTVAPGGVLTVVAANGPGNATDWVALAAVGAPSTISVAWRYLGGGTGGSLTFTAPATPGGYEARFFANDGFVRLATSSPFNVQPPSALSVNNVNLAERDSGSTTATFTVTLAPTTTSAVTVNYATGNGTAVAGSDYTATSGTLTFAPGIATQTVSVSVTGDTIAEPDETFVLTLSNPVNAVLGDAEGAGTVLNDDAPPPPTITASPSTVALGAAITVVVANGPGNPKDWVALSLTGSPATSSVAWRYLGGGTGATLTFVGPSTPGAYEARLFANDEYTRLATSNIVTVTETTPPVITNVTSSSITVSGATISWATDEPSDTQVNYGLTTAYGSSTVLNGSLVTAHTAPVTGLTAGTTYHYRVRSRDAAGNLALSGDFTFTTGDTTPPTVAMSAPSAGATVSGAVTLAATASDAVGVAGVQFRVDGAPFGPEDVAAPYTVPWNTAGSADLVFGVTKVIVGPMTMTAGSGFTKRLSVSCPGCSGEDMVTEDRIQTTAGAAAATWTFSIPAHYVAQMAAFKAAGTPAYVQGAVYTSHTVSGAIAQAFGANVAAGNLLVAAVAWQGASPVSAADNRGNVYAVATQAYDVTNDQSLAILYAPNANSGATTVTVSFGGATPGVQRMELHEYTGIATTNPLDAAATNSGDGGTVANGITTGAATTTVTAPVTNGSHTLTAVARDAAGNTTTSAAVTVTVNNGGDLTAPVITGVAVSAITSSGATFTWTTNEASDSEVEYGPTTAYGGFSTLNATRVTAHTMGVSGLTPNVLYHYRLRSRDAAGNLGLSGDFTFTTLEGTPPAVAITAPAPGAIVSGTIMVTASASDNVGVVGVQFRVDGAPLGAEDMTAPYAVSWNTATAAGSPVLTAVARDAASNQRTSSPVTVTVATANVTLAWDPNAESDLDGYKVYLGTASQTYSTMVDVGNVTSYTVTGLQTGTLYYFAVTAYDTGGLESGASNEVSATR